MAEMTVWAKVKRSRDDFIPLLSFCCKKADDTQKSFQTHKSHLFVLENNSLLPGPEKDFWTQCNCKYKWPIPDVLSWSVSSPNLEGFFMFSLSFPCVLCLMCRSGARFTSRQQLSSTTAPNTRHTPSNCQIVVSRCLVDTVQLLYFAKQDFEVKI